MTLRRRRSQLTVTVKFSWSVCPAVSVTFRVNTYVPATVGVPMMLPPSVPWEAGGVMPVGTAPATTVHVTGVGVACPSAVVLQPVVWNQTTPIWLIARWVAPAGGVITQVPVGPAGGVTGLVVGVQPVRVTVSRFDLLSCSTTLQSGAVKPLAWILNLPASPARAPADEVVELAAMKPVAAPEPSTVSLPDCREALLTLRVPAAVAVSRAACPASIVRAAVGMTRARRIRTRDMMWFLLHGRVRARRRGRPGWGRVSRAVPLDGMDHPRALRSEPSS